MGRTGRWQDISTAGKIRCQVKTKKTYEKLAKSGKEATFTCVLVVHVYLLCWKTYAWHLGALLRSQFHSVQVSLLGMAWFSSSWANANANSFLALVFPQLAAFLQLSAFSLLGPFGILHHPAHGNRLTCVNGFCGKCFSIRFSNKNSQPTHRCSHRRKVHKFSVLFAPAPAAAQFAFEGVWLL